MSDTNHYPAFMRNLSKKPIHAGDALPTKLPVEHYPAHYLALHNKYLKMDPRDVNVKGHDVTASMKEIIKIDNNLRGEDLVNLWNKNVDEAFKYRRFTNPIDLAKYINGGIATGSPYLGVDTVGKLGLAVPLKKEAYEKNFSSFLAGKKPSDYYLGPEAAITLANRTSTRETDHKSIAAALTVIARASSNIENLEIKNPIAKIPSITIRELNDVGFPTYGSLKEESGRIIWDTRKIELLKPPIKTSGNFESPANENGNYVAAFIENLKNPVALTDREINQFVVAAAELPNDHNRSIANPVKVL